MDDTLAELKTKEIGDSADAGSPNGEAADQNVAAADQNGEEAFPEATTANLKRMDEDLAELKKKFSLFEKRAAADPGAEAKKRRIEDDPNIYDSIAELKNKVSHLEANQFRCESGYNYVGYQTSDSKKINFSSAFKTKPTFILGMIGFFGNPKDPFIAYEGL